MCAPRIDEHIVGRVGSCRYEAINGREGHYVAIEPVKKSGLWRVVAIPQASWQKMSSQTVAYVSEANLLV
jgi:hypothetical protein